MIGYRTPKLKMISEVTREVDLLWIVSLSRSAGHRFGSEILHLSRVYMVRHMQSKRS